MVLGFWKCWVRVFVYAVVRSKNIFLGCGYGGIFLVGYVVFCFLFLDESVWF